MPVSLQYAYCRFISLWYKRSIKTPLTFFSGPAQIAAHFSCAAETSSLFGHANTHQLMVYFKLSVGLIDLSQWSLPRVSAERRNSYITTNRHHFAWTSRSLRCSWSDRTNNPSISGLWPSSWDHSALDRRISSRLHKYEMHRDPPDRIWFYPHIMKNRSSWEWLRLHEQRWSK
jgi:hypothetical protein